MKELSLFESTTSPHIFIVIFRPVRTCGRQAPMTRNAVGDEPPTGERSENMRKQFFSYFLTTAIAAVASLAQATPPPPAAPSPPATAAEVAALAAEIRALGARLEGKLDALGLEVRDLRKRVEVLEARPPARVYTHGVYTPGVVYYVPVTRAYYTYSGWYLYRYTPSGRWVWVTD